MDQSGGTTDQRRWNGGPKWVERRTSRVERRTSGAVEQQTPLNLLCDGLSATTLHTSSSRHDYASSPKAKALGWLEDRVNVSTDTRGVNRESRRAGRGVRGGPNQLLASQGMTPVGSDPASVRVPARIHDADFAAATSTTGEGGGGVVVL